MRKNKITIIGEGSRELISEAIRFLMIVAAFFIYETFGAFAYDKPTIAAILSEIEENNLTLKSMQSQNAAEVMESRADNVLGSTSIEYSPFFQSGVTGVASSELIVKQEFDFPTQYVLRSKYTAAKRDALDASFMVRQRDIRVEAYKMCISHIASVRKLELLKKRLAGADTLLQLYEEKFALRSVSLLDLDRIRLSRNDLLREISRIRIEADEAAARLKLLNGGKGVSLDGLEYDVPVTDVPLPVSVDAFTAQSPEIKAAEALIRESERNLNLVRSNWLPSVGIGYRRNTEFSESSNGFVVGLDFPVFSAPKQTRAAQARKLAAEMALSETESRVSLETTSVLNRLKIMREALDLSDRRLIENSIGLYAESLRLGQITMTEYCQETDALYARLLDLCTLEQDFRLLAATLIN